MRAWHAIFEISGCFDSPFLAESGGEEQYDGLLGYEKVPTINLAQNKLLSLIALT